MSSIQEKRGVWYYQWRECGKQKKKCMKTRDRSVALQIQRQWDAKRELFSQGIAPKRLDFADVFEKFLSLKETQVKPASMERYKKQASLFVEGLGVKNVSEINTEKINAYVSDRQRKGIANKTITDELTLLKGLFRYLTAEGLLRELPVRTWPILKQITKDPERIGFYSRGEIEKLKNEIKGTEFEGVFLFSLYTGVRRSEVQGVRFRDLRLDENVVLIRSIKTEGAGEQIRHVPIHKDLAEYLKCRSGKANDYIFPELQAHSRNWPQVQMLKYCQKLEITYRRFHGLRHTVATYMLTAGVPVQEVMDILGWSNLETVQAYAHFARSLTREMKLPY